MVIYQYEYKREHDKVCSMLDVDPNLKYVSGWSCMNVGTMEAKPTRKPQKRGKEGEYSVGDVLFVCRMGKGLWCEIIALEPIKANIADKIKNCNTMAELDTLRLEIVSDRDHFLDNQKLFISAKNRIKRISF